VLKEFSSSKSQFQTRRKFKEDRWKKLTQLTFNHSSVTANSEICISLSQCCG
jgi:hypothetical protein